MCTVSIIGMTQPGARAGAGGRHSACGFRLITNRDELRTRPAATAPKWHDPSMCVVGAEDGDAAALFPVDPAGGGTWVGASPRGLVLCLLNANPLPAPALPGRGELISRGLIIPRLLVEHAEEGLEGVMRGVREFELDRFAPFRLVGVELTDGREAAAFRVAEATWDRTGLSWNTHEAGPACFVSSALGDPLVKPRLALFEAMVRGPFASPGQGQALAQDRFHRHVWPGRTEISVLMSRPDARTVSITTVEVWGAGSMGGAMGSRRPGVSMRYESVVEPQVVAKPGAAAVALRRSPV